jgi:hypothetical protein
MNSWLKKKIFRAIHTKLAVFSFVSQGTVAKIRVFLASHACRPVLAWSLIIAVI